MARAAVSGPVYKQVIVSLEKLARTEFSVGEQFLTERQVSERYAISRPTANKALTSLVADGILEFRKGVGTFVRPPKPNVNLRELVSFTQKARAAGLTPTTWVGHFSTRITEAVTILPVADVAAALGVPSAATVYQMERFRSLDGDPCIFERRVLREDLCPELTAGECAGSLYSLFAGRYELELDGVAQRIRARNASATEASALGCAAGDAVLELTGVGHLAGGEPLWYEQTLYRGDRYEFVNQLRISGSTDQSSLDPRSAADENQTESTLWHEWS